MTSDARNRRTLVMLLAGGQGERLYPLTRDRAKPAVPFGGLYRIVDFTLSNCLNSGLRRIFVLTQHQSLSLDRHLRLGWSILHPESGDFIQNVPPQLRLVSRWYAGTADALFQNLHLLEEERPQHVLVLSGDHIYRMNYELLLDFHVRNDAAATLACTEVPLADATRMGVVQIDAKARIRGFAEKPAVPTPVPDHPARALASMGVYVFETEALVRALIADAKTRSAHDFGRDIIPNLIHTQRVTAFDIDHHLPPAQCYWRDVGTLDSYFEANMELLRQEPAFDLFDRNWPLRTHFGPYPPALVRDAGEQQTHVVDTILSPGSRVRGGSVQWSILSPGVEVEAGAVVEESILMPRVRVGERSIVRRAIVDENVHLPAGTRIGCSAEDDRKRFVVTERGVVVVASNTLLG
jgi:glucose-1-phosphate adenylyltransferase